MARISFSLKATDDSGVLRGHDNGDPNDSDGLRADGLQIAPASFLSQADTYFQVQSNSYGEVDIEWMVPIEEVGVVVPQLTQSVVVYSRNGPPETVGSGKVVATLPEVPGNGIPDTTTVLSVPTLKFMPEGEFAYFSLFVRYQSVDDDYYEKVAELWEIVPQNYGSTLEMWERVPDYYQNEDTKMGTLLTADEANTLGFETYTNPVGPLLKYLSIFGFEMDRSRSILRHIARAKDPEHADAESLDALAFELGTVLDGKELGYQRLRNLVNDIGTFRREKGTKGATEFFVKALTGSDADVDTAVLTRAINIAPMRVNRCITPINPSSLTGTRAAADDEATRPGSPTGGKTYPAEYNGYAFDDAVPTSQGGWVYEITNSPVTVSDGDVLHFSVHGDYGQHLLRWARTVDDTTGEVYDFCVVDPTPLSPSPEVPRPIVYDTVTYFSIPCTEANMGTTSKSVRVEFMVAPGNFHESRFLIERNSIGGYFDGSTTLGGWLIGDGSSISDYRWEGTENLSLSIYNEDYQRTKLVLQDLIDDVLPVNVADAFVLNFNVT